MIPQRVYLQGLLCYRGEQELSLGDASIWILSGPNGSGKSAVFDAVTFALFGYHRGGKTNARELINKDENGLAVEFDFLLDGELFRLRRTARKRGVGTRQVSHWLASSAPGGIWEAVPDTDTDRGFDLWVREHIGLTYESFTSSVLLLQGQAERVLSPRSSDRRAILESIIDLDRYQRLHERVDEKRKHLKSQAETLGKQLQGIPLIRESDLAAARAQVEACDQASQKARESTARFQSLMTQAEQGARLDVSLAANRNSHEQAQGLLTNADAIRSGWRRLQELRAVLPPLKTIVDQRGRLAATERTIAELAADGARLTGQITQIAARLAEFRQRRQSVEVEISADEKQLQAVGLRLRDLSQFLGRIRFSEQQRNELTELKKQLALFPSDPAGALATAEREHDQLLAIGQLISPMTRLLSEREAHRQVALRLTEAIAAEPELADAVQGLKDDCAELGRRAEALELARRQADRQVTEARTLRDQAARAVQDFRDIAGHKTCPHCGQTLTAAHLETERVRVEANLASLEIQLKTATNSQVLAEQQEKHILNVKARVEGELASQRDRLNELRQNVQAHRRDQQKHAMACQKTYEDELDDSARRRIFPQVPADWLSTTYPAQADLDDLQQQVARLSAVRETLRRCQTIFDKYNKLQDRASFIGKSLDAQQGDPSCDPATLRDEYEQLIDDEPSIRQRLSDHRQRLAEEVATAEALTTQLNSAQRQLSANQGEWKGTCDRQREAQCSLEESLKGLPCDWHATAEGVTGTVLHDLQTEWMQLSRQDLEARHSALLQAQANVDSLRQTVVDLEQQRAELTAEASQPVTQIEDLLINSQRRQSDANKALQEAQLCADRLVQRQSLRRQLRDEYLQVSKQHSLYHILAELLGPRKLQRELVRRAEREIVDLANMMLDRVSGGQLELTLAGQDKQDDDYLDRNVFQLQARNRSTAKEPLGVAFLSGSQRFRVAVSLALGMGQYASARRRSIQSVIIDEGFGSLDREGRQVMIQELHNLRGHLERIVLVSHQEEFADAFPDGYRFELKNGATQISRFHH